MVDFRAELLGIDVDPAQLGLQHVGQLGSEFWGMPCRAHIREQIRIHVRYKVSARLGSSTPRSFFQALFANSASAVPKVRVLHMFLWAGYYIGLWCESHVNLEASYSC